MRTELFLEAVKQKIVNDTSLKSMLCNGFFYMEVPASNEDGTPFQPPFVMLDVSEGNPEWNTGNDAPVDDVWTITVFTINADDAIAAKQKLFDAFHDQEFEYSGFSQSLMTGSGTGKDDELGTYAWIELTVTSTETKTKNV